jgi:regulator of replication initiation timing
MAKQEEMFRKQLFDSYEQNEKQLKSIQERIMDADDNIQRSINIQNATELPSDAETLKQRIRELQVEKTRLSEALKVSISH